MVTGEQKEAFENGHVTEDGHAKDKFTDLAAILMQPKHLGTVVVNSEADEYNPSLAEELNLKAK